jgi:UDP-N-acetylglucosamine diphosphorylase/glucosamine-1-phosphate N-acetyltransferase
MNLFDDNKISDLYPLTLTKPAAELRIGINTIAQKWKVTTSLPQLGYICANYLAIKYKAVNSPLNVNGRLLPTADLWEHINKLNPNEFLVKQNEVLAYHTSQGKSIEYAGKIELINRPFDIFKMAEAQITEDMLDLVDQRVKLSSTVTVMGDHMVFVGENVQAEACVINAVEGPVYLGNNATIMEGALIRGPFAMCEGAVVKMGSKIYKNTVLGPYCVAGGELSNVIMQAYSNKGHDGFLGNAVLGEWCNIGADSNCSNLKNNYDDIKLWNYSSSRFEKSGEQFCGLIMGDHSKCGINTMFNTGTVVGVACNIFGSGFPRNFVPDFSWGGAQGFVDHKIDAALKTASLVMPRRKKELNEVEKGILEAVFEMSKAWRNWER